MHPAAQEVMRTVVESNIRFIRLWFTDVSGQLKAVAIDPGELEAAFSEGLGFDGSAVQGLTRVYESDMLLRPDPTTFALLPNQGEKVARMFCDLLTPEGKPALSDPRGVLERTLRRAEEIGFSVQIHTEVEFYMLKQTSDPLAIEPVDNAGYFDYVARGGSNDFRRRAVQALEDMGISVEFSHHEAGPGQNEIDLRAADALTAADNIQSLHTVVQEIALSENQMATFMPKPFIDYPGSGMHTHISLLEGGSNAFYDPAGQHRMSRTARAFIAGLLRHAREISAVVNQHVNSYKRLWGGGEAPCYICWGHNNRSALVRIPLYKPGKGQDARVEYRAIDSAANPYLAFAVLIAAGLAGVQGRYDLMEEAQDDVWQLSDSERAVLGIEDLPHSLKDAIDAMARSELVATTLGEEAFDYVLRDKVSEWNAYRAQVTPWELRKAIRPL
ncbi:glutamine synthetase family protein [Gleimia hominis]|uniref:glutamine synthetase family protein n=1 Tax=Gleimia hominis TaxID=595468 RepID=UPI0026AA20FF